jgi:hypothetical protein
MISVKDVLSLILYYENLRLILVKIIKLSTEPVCTSHHIHATVQKMCNTEVNPNRFINCTKLIWKVSEKDKCLARVPTLFIGGHAD